jgi:hypothetical protein
MFYHVHTMVIVMAKVKSAKDEAKIKGPWIKCRLHNIAYQSDESCPICDETIR